MKKLFTPFLALALCAALLPLNAQTVVTDPSKTKDGDKGYAVAGTAGVASTTVGTAGTGYTSLPTVAFSGGTGGEQATGTATLKVVGSVTVTAGGTGYTVGDVLTLVGGTKTTAATFTVSTVSSGVITAVAIANAGVYTVPQTATGAATTGGTGTGATLTVGYGVGTITLVTAGEGYLTAPTIGFSGGAGSGAAATATLAAFTTVAKFDQIIPLADCVISAITHPTSVMSGSYTANDAIVGKTLTKGIIYTIYGDSVTLSSGHAILRLRARP